jgi:hypothetical protein
VARSTVDALLKLNPNYARWVSGVPLGDRGQITFLMASRWPDAIKRDKDYTNDGVDNGETPVEPVSGLRPATQANVPIFGRSRIANRYLNTVHGTLGWPAPARMGSTRGCRGCTALPVRRARG